MNVTQIKESIFKFVNPKSNHEKSRINNMYNGNIKYHNMFNRMKELDVNDEKAIRKFWHDYNIKQAELERWYKKQKHEMKTSKFQFEDFSDQAYNNSSEYL